MMDAYQTLGISRDASPEDIKRAYRKLAAQHHPDKGGDTAKFQEIQSAYETLTDPQKRQQHDNPNPFGAGGPNSSHFEFHFGGGSPEDIFQRFFQQGFGPHPFHRQPRRNKDLRVSISVDLSSTMYDQDKTINVQTTKNDRFTVDITIPRGISSGTTIKYPLQGDNFFESLPRGDLFIVVNVVEPQNFSVSGLNLITTLTIDSIEAILGVVKEISGVENKKFLLTIPQGCQHGDKFSINGQGLYQMHSSHRGNLIVHVNVKTPILNQEQLNILKTIKTTL